MSGLDACTNYQFSVSAITPSQYISDVSSDDFETTEDTPSEPRQVTSHSVTQTSLGLEWFEPLVSGLL